MLAAVDTFRTVIQVLRLVVNNSTKYTECMNLVRLTILLFKVNEFVALIIIINCVRDAVQCVSAECSTLRCYPVTPSIAHTFDIIPVLSYNLIFQHARKIV